MILLIVALVVAVVSGGAYAVAHLPQWFWHPLGLCVGTPHQVMLCKGYNAWSGSFSDISEITLVVSVLTLLFGAWHHVNCAAPRCPRVGKHKTADGHHRLCRGHHPDLPNHKLSLAEIHERHFAAKP